MIIHYHSLAEKGDILPHLWQRLLADDPPPWFWGNIPPLSLTDFICYFSDLQRQLFLVCTDDGQDFIGVAWLDEIILGQRARGHFYFFKKYRGKRSARIPRVLTELKAIVAAPPLSLQVLLLFTDSRAHDAHKAAMRLGAIYLPGVIPCYYPGEALIHIGYITLKGSDHGVTLRTTTHPDGQHGDHGAGDALHECGEPGAAP